MNTERSNSDNEAQSTSLLPDIQQILHKTKTKVAVLDDDVVGTRAVHNVPVILGKSQSVFLQMFQRETPTFHIISNTRHLSNVDARAINRLIIKHLQFASQQTGLPFVVVNRGAATLAGYDPLLDTLEENFDIALIVGDHAENPTMDAAVVQAGPIAIRDALLALRPGSVCHVAAATPSDIEAIALGVLMVHTTGCRVLCRGSSTLAATVSGMTSQPPLETDDIFLRSGKGGLIVFGSYEDRSLRQLDMLLTRTLITDVEVDVDALLDDKRQGDEIVRCSDVINRAIGHSDVILHTSRVLIDDGYAFSQVLAQRVDTALTAILRGLNCVPRYMLVHGSITANNIAAQVFNVRRAMVSGQLIPNVPVWTFNNSQGEPYLSYIILPAGLDDVYATTRIVKKLEDA